jgi:hypothetical protein
LASRYKAIAPSPWGGPSKYAAPCPETHNPGAALDEQIRLLTTIPGFSPTAGISNQLVEGAEIGKTMAERVNRVILTADSSK